MRVTNRMLLSMVQYSISRASGRMGDLHAKLSTGKRVNVPSDDPPAAATALALRAAMAENEQYVKNAESAKTWLSATEAGLKNLEDTLTQAKTLAIRAANDTFSDDQVWSMAQQAEHLLQQAVQIGNATLGDDFLFAGFRVETRPFTYTPGTFDPGPPPSVIVSPSVTYNGDDGIMVRTVGRGVNIGVNTPGSSLFPEAFQALVDLTTQLAQGQNDSLPLDELDRCIGAVSSAHGEVGAKVNRLNEAIQRFSAVGANLASVLSRTEDLDYAEAITELTGQETIYRAALEAAARINQISLLDYLK
ncbi:MAG: flagellar hook-associated protein FlgL [Chloroflexota bacterium]